MLHGNFWELLPTEIYSLQEYEGSSRESRHSEECNRLHESTMGSNKRLIRRVRMSRPTENLGGAHRVTEAFREASRRIREVLRREEMTRRGFSFSLSFCKALLNVEKGRRNTYNNIYPRDLSREMSPFKGNIFKSPVSGFLPVCDSWTGDNRS